MGNTPPGSPRGGIAGTYPYGGNPGPAYHGYHQPQHADLYSSASVSSAPSAGSLQDHLAVGRPTTTGALAVESGDLAGAYQYYSSLPQNAGPALLGDGPHPGSIHGGNLLVGNGPATGSSSPYQQPLRSQILSDDIVFTPKRNRGIFTPKNDAELFGDPKMTAPPFLNRPFVRGEGETLPPGGAVFSYDRVRPPTAPPATSSSFGYPPPDTSRSRSQQELLLPRMQVINGPAAPPASIMNSRGVVERQVEIVSSSTPQILGAESDTELFRIQFAKNKKKAREAEVKRDFLAEKVREMRNEFREDHVGENLSIADSNLDMIREYDAKLKDWNGKLSTALADLIAEKEKRVRRKESLLRDLRRGPGLTSAPSTAITTQDPGSEEENASIAQYRREIDRLKEELHTRELEMHELQEHAEVEMGTLIGHYETLSAQVVEELPNEAQLPGDEENKTQRLQEEPSTRQLGETGGIGGGIEERDDTSYRLQTVS
ncbi:unnamed protein product [Amoebophrya sp. A25]|nr:unnamed protein product [Amoebophrya sp. A25]|eukprot:GSA25T00022128001.1